MFSLVIVIPFVRITAIHPLVEFESTFQVWPAVTKDEYHFGITGYVGHWKTCVNVSHIYRKKRRVDNPSFVCLPFISSTVSSIEERYSFLLLSFFLLLPLLYSSLHSLHSLMSSYKMSFFCLSRPYPTSNSRDITHSTEYPDEWMDPCVSSSSKETLGWTSREYVSRGRRVFRSEWSLAEQSSRSRIPQEWKTQSHVSGILFIDTSGIQVTWCSHRWSNNTNTGDQLKKGFTFVATKEKGISSLSPKARRFTCKTFFVQKEDILSSSDPLFFLKLRSLSLKICREWMCIQSFLLKNEKSFSYFDFGSLSLTFFDFRFCSFDLSLFLFGWCL